MKKTSQVHQNDVQNRKSSASDLESNNAIDAPSFILTANNSSIQKKANPLQMVEEEEELQMKKAPFQLSAAEEEEELQMKKAPFQLSGEEEEEVQMKKDKSSPHSSQLESSTKTTLPEAVQAKMESSLGADFSNVAIHKNSTKAENIGAQAYAQGNDVHFASNKYDPSSKGGQELIGHELTHVVQQRQGRVQATTQMKGADINDNKSLEDEADKMGAKAAVGEVTGLNGDAGSQNISSKQNTTQYKIDQVPEETGKRQSGPLAVRGEGDEHAFSPNDINQGAIGDCFFLASLAAVANTNPELLENAIKDNGNRTYNVTLYSYEDAEKCYTTLQPRTVTIEATFPTEAAGHDDANPDTSTLPGHAHGGDRNFYGIGGFGFYGGPELWVRLIEKAYAIINGGYANIADGGLVGDAMEALTGNSYGYYGSENDESFIIDAVGRGEPLALSSKDQDAFDALSGDLETFADTNDIVGGHAYAVISADEDSITVRNPWGENASSPVVVLTWAQYRTYFHGYSAPSS